MNPLGAVFGAMKYLPASLARQALEKVNPGFKSYFSKAISYGVDANRALDYLTDRFESDAQKSYKQQLEAGAARNTLRPDEMVSRSQMANAELPLKAAKTGIAALAGGLAGRGAGAALGAMQAGSAEPQPMAQEAPQASAQVEQQSPLAPDLQQFLDERIQMGRSPVDASFDARKVHTLLPSIKKAEAKFNAKLPQIIESLYGGVQSQPRQQKGSGTEALLQAIQAYKASKGR